MDCLQDYTAAGLAAAQALELRKGSIEYQEDVERMLCRMPRPHADAIEVTPDLWSLACYGHQGCLKTVQHGHHRMSADDKHLVVW